MADKSIRQSASSGGDPCPRTAKKDLPAGMVRTKYQEGSRRKIKSSAKDLQARGQGEGRSIWKGFRNK